MHQLALQKESVAADLERAAMAAAAAALAEPDALEDFRNDNGFEKKKHGRNNKPDNSKVTDPLEQQRFSETARQRLTQQLEKEEAQRQSSPS